MGTPSNTAKELLRATALDNAASKSKLEDDLEQDGFARSSSDRSENLYGQAMRKTPNNKSIKEQHLQRKHQEGKGEWMKALEGQSKGV